MSDSEDEGVGSPQLSLSGFSSLFSISGTAPHPRHHLGLPPPSLSLGGEEEEEEEDQVVSSGQGATARVRMMRIRESALRSRARKRAYVQELEKEIRLVAADNLRLRMQCILLTAKLAERDDQRQPKRVGGLHRRTSSTQF